MEDDECVSCNKFSTTWHLSNDTKALFADEFVDKDYSIYTEVF